MKYVLAGVSTVALGALIWYLSKDDEALDYRKYSKDRLMRLMEEVELELTCIYARNYNLLLKIKEESPDDFGPGAMNELRTLVNNEIKDKQAQVIDDFCFACHPKTHSDASGHAKEPITFGQFISWVEKYADEDFMTKQAENIAQLDSDLFEKQRISHLSFEDEIPEELTAEKYL